jgi:hypothetical protein
MNAGATGEQPRPGPGLTWSRPVVDAAEIKGGAPGLDV